MAAGRQTSPATLWRCGGRFIVMTVRGALSAGLLFLALVGLPGVAGAGDPVLYLTHSTGFRHDVLPLSEEILKELGKRSAAFDVTATDDVANLAREKLDRYGAVIFFTTGELPIGEDEKGALLDFVRSGRGFIGVHSATDTFYLWSGYRDLVGGYFNNHPWHQPVRVTVADPANPLVAFLGTSFEIADEIYQISDFDDRGSTVLLRLDPSSVDLASGDVRRRPYGWPLAWSRSFGTGRVFYVALGHDEAVWRDPRYQQLLLNAVLWTLRKPLVSLDAAR
jgi:type 1 glutamine amidotransferase